MRAIGSNVFGYSFASFMNDVEWRVRFLAATVKEPDFVWPGLLILDLPDGIAVESFAIGQTAEKHERLVAELVTILRGRPVRYFAWVMPCLREQDSRQVECLLIVFGTRGRAEAAIAEWRRAEAEAPRLGRFSRGAFGSGARRVSGRFVEPLLEALDS